MLAGKNISIRPATAEDALLLAGWFSDPAYMGEFNNVWPVTPAQMTRDISMAPSDRSGGMFVITRNDNGEPAGAIGYFNPYALADFFKGYEIWYQVHPGFRRKGIARQAVSLLINHLFDALPVERLQATIEPENKASIRVIEQAGMQRDGVYRKVTFLHGRYSDMLLYSITREDWGSEEAYRKGREF